MYTLQYGIDPLLDVPDVDGKKSDPWSSSSSSSLLTQHLAAAKPSSWVNSATVLPPPPAARPTAVQPPVTLAPATADPWQSSLDSSQRKLFAAACVSVGTFL